MRQEEEFQTYVYFFKKLYVRSKQVVKKTLKKHYSPHFMDSRLQTQSYRATLRRQFTFYHLVSRNYWYSFDRPRKDERLNWTWSHPGVLKTGTLDCQSRALTTRSLLHCTIIGQHLVLRHFGRPQTADPEICLIFLFSK